MENYVMSSECLMGDPNNGYKNSAITAKILREATQEYNVSIVTFLRRQDDFVESMYTQNIHQGRTFDFDTFLNVFKPESALNYMRILNDFQLEFGKKQLIIKSYHIASQTGLINDFAGIIGSRLLSGSIKQRKNPSYSKSAIEIARICNPHLNNKEQWKMRKVLQDVMAKEKGEVFSFFSPSLREQFMDKYEISNQEVADCYFNGNLANLFPLEIGSQQKVITSGVTNEQVANLILSLLESER